MQIQRNKQLEIKIVEVLRKHLIKDRKGIHVTDLTRCLRQSFYSKKYKEYNEGAELFFLRGKSLHGLLEDYMIRSDLFPDSVGEVSNKLDGIFGTCDILTPSLIVELKTATAIFKNPIRPYYHHIEQLCFYLSMFKRMEGSLVYLLLAQPDEFNKLYTKRRQKLIVWDVLLGDNDREYYISSMIKRRNQLVKAIMYNYPLSLSIDTTWCKLCPYTDKCPDNIV